MVGGAAAATPEQPKRTTAATSTATLRMNMSGFLRGKLRHRRRGRKTTCPGIRTDDNTGRRGPDHDEWLRTQLGRQAAHGCATTSDGVSSEATSAARSSV